jgi:precorrin-4 methylase
VLSKEEIRELAEKLEVVLNHRGNTVDDVVLAELANGDLKAVIRMKGDEPTRYGAFTKEQIQRLYEETNGV